MCHRAYLNYYIGNPQEWYYYLYLTGKEIEQRGVHMLFSNENTNHFKFLCIYLEPWRQIRTLLYICVYEYLYITQYIIYTVYYIVYINNTVIYKIYKYCV